jgi:hypothetical protein
MIAKSDAASIFRDTRGSRSIKISVPGAFTAVGFSGQQKNPGASAAERARPSLFKTIDEDRRERHDHINRSDRSTYPGRISVLTSGATPDPGGSTERGCPKTTFVCRHCGAPMLVIETFARAQHIRGPP